MSEIIRKSELYEFNLYPKREVVFVKGENAKLWDENGKEYIDCVAGIGVASIGHCNQEVSEAIANQSRQLITCPGIFHNDVRSNLLQKLVEISPECLTKVFLTNSGTESVEAAIKFARITTGKTDFIAAMRGFHGRSMGALSATFKPEYREEFKPLVPGFKHVPFNKFEKLELAVTENTAGIILELIQGEGGINIVEQEYIKQVRELCDKRNVLLIIDEIQTGFCRTGKMFASDLFGVEPDMLTCAKAIAGGFPLGAVLCSDKIKVPIGKHGTTFGGNPLGCAAANASIKYMQDNKLDEQAQKKGEYFVSHFNVDEFDNVRQIRNAGLMIGIEMKIKVQSIIVRLMERGVLCMPAGKTVLRFLPPLTISYEELDKVLEELKSVLKES